MEGMIGEIRGFAGSFAPRDWAFCQGQLLAIAQNTALFSILGTTYGGDGRTTFGLPDLRGRVPISEGRGPGLSNRIRGSFSGTETVSLDVPQIPSHSHTTTAQLIGATISGTASATMHINNDSSGVEGGSGAFLGKPDNDAIYASDVNGSELNPQAITVDTSELKVDIQGASVTVNPTGGSRAHDNMQPYLVINWLICLWGEYPQRS